MRHHHPKPVAEVEGPLSVYLDHAKDQVARSVADGFLSGHRSEEIARALAHMNRDADRAARSRDAAACAAADRQPTAPMLAGVGL